MAENERPSAVLYANHILRDAAYRDFDLRVTLDFEARFLRRKRMVTDCGIAFTVDLAETVYSIRMMHLFWKMVVRL